VLFTAEKGKVKNQNPSFQKKTPFQKKEGQKWCGHCRYTNHTEEECFKLHPNLFKPKKRYGEG
jgi:hypothetical protein